MGSKFWLVARLLAGVMVLACVTLLVAPTGAHAGVTLSAPTPTPGSSVAYANPLISIHASGTANLPLPQSITVDGLSLNLSATYLETGGHWEDDGCDQWWVPDTWDYRYATFAGYGPNLTDGAHVVTALITETGGQSATQTWSFNVAQAPTIGTVSPSVTTTNTTPLIRIPFSDNPGTHTCTLTVGGQTVPTVRVGNEFQAQIVEPLTPGATYSASATVTDQDGRSATSTWTFRAFSADSITATMSPANGATASYYPSVSITVSSAVEITSIYFSTDGGPQSYSYVQKISSTRYSAYHYPGALADGWHTTTVIAYIPGGGSRTFSTTYFVNQPPSLSSPVPSAGGRTTQTTPTISVSYSDNAPSNRTATMTVDGVPVTPTVSASTISYKPTTPLTQEQTHTVSVRLVDAAGNPSTMTWSFWVDRYAAMPTTECATCHPTYPGTHEARNCDLACHSSSGHGDDNCDSCHGGHSFTPCNSCHAATATGSHETLSGAPHNSTTPFDSCRACHSPSLTREHARYTAAGGARLDCLTCHSATAATAVKTAIANSDTRCSACHTSADHVTLHVSATSSGCFGAGCHPASKNLADVHAQYVGPGSERPQYADSCALCHDNPAVDTATSGTRCTPACHDGFTHSEAMGMHTPSAASAACTECHSGTIDTVHKAGVNNDWARCAICHDEGDNWKKTADCAGCHTEVHANNEAAHRATPGGATIDVFSASSPHTTVEHVGTKAYADCALCHDRSLIEVHEAVGCSACHGAGKPATGIATWDKTCTAGPCHDSFHDAAATSHDAAYAQRRCETCHDPASWTTPQARCGTCHDINDVVPPTTTCDAKKLYNAKASIRFTASDAPQAGAVTTNYRVDGGDVLTGTLAEVTATPSACVTHTVEYWSVDAVGNEEARKTATFAIDSAPPVTTTDAKASYVGSASIKLTATDADGSGIASVNSRIDGGGVRNGTTVTYNVVGTHTLTYWSVDVAGNVEQSTTVTFTVTAPAQGTICFAWDEPAPGSWATVYVRDGSGNLIASKGSSSWSPAGWFTFQVPVSATPYQLSAYWYDADSDTTAWSYGSALVNTNKKTVTWWY